MSTGGLHVSDLRKHFGSVEAVRGVSFQVEPGTMAGLLGPNGAGKSTTIKMITTMLSPTSGDATLDGFSIIHHPFEVRKRLGIIFQDPSLDQRLTGRENLDFHCMLYQVPKVDRKRRIDELTQIVELGNVLDRPVKTYSGGMKRRLELARGLLHRPKLLILDEPTVGLDPQTRTSIWSYIRELRQRYGMAVLMTTHYMEEAEGCQSIYIIDQGQMIAEGSPLELTQQLGGNRVELQVPEVYVAQAKSWLVEELQVEGFYDSKKGLVFTLPQDSTGFHNKLFTCPYPIVSYSTTAFSLEDVFIMLTGKTIRDDEAGRVDQLRTTMRKKRGM